MSTHRHEKASSKKIKVGVYQLLIPHYRRGFYRELSRCSDLDVSICSPNRSKDGEFFNLELSGNEFRHVPISIWKCRLPFGKKKRPVWFFPSLISDLLKGTYDVTLLYFYPGNLSMWIGLLLGRLLNRRICVWGHAVSRGESRLMNWMQGAMMRLGRSRAFYTEKERDFWIARGIAAEKLFVHYNSLDTHASDQVQESLSPEHLEEFRRSAGLCGKKVLIYTGRLLPYKKPEILVEVLDRVSKQVPNAHVVFIGDGPQREELQALAESLDLTDKITFTGPIFDEELLACYFLSSYVSVMPHHAGLAVNHAFAYGVPVVTGDNFIKHPPEVVLIVDHVTGLFCRDGDVDDFARVIENLLTDDDLRETMSRNARKVIEEKFNVDKMADGMRQAILFAAGR